MRYAVISDIHGNYPALKAVLNDVLEQGAERLIFLGDYFLDFPYANEVAEAIQNLDNAYIIKGNKENYLTSDYVKQPWVYEQMNSLYWNINNIKKENLDYFIGLPEEMTLAGDSGEMIKFFHDPGKVFKGTAVMRLGSGRYYYKMKEKPFTKTDYSEHINALFSGNDDLYSLLTRLPDGAYLFGHTHVQWHWKLGGKLLLNAGSCGLPLDFDTRAAYSIIEYIGCDWKVYERRVPYKVGETVDALKSSSLYSAAKDWSDVMIEQLTAGEERLSFLLKLSADIAGESNTRNQPFPNNVWRLACEMYRKNKY